ncbi:flavin reductase [Halostreptopolyspora alba]|uniref:Flavin reductase n=2 Tax=Halostreptopolyspora alba TaxID=2487137 RepID=A0A3N0EID8_9ACTN|nr:flavin reductase [Nocardiopsaceae bacterium YIM 96095]
MAEHEGVDAEEFKSTFRHHPAGVAVVTADDGAGPAGLTATSVVAVSAEPALLAFSLTSASTTAPRVLGARTAVVHLLGAGEVGLARRFATGGIDRFADPGSWTRLPTGEPLLREVTVWLRCRIAQRLTAGDSTLVLGEVLGTHQNTSDRCPLVYQNRTFYVLGESAVVT